MTAKELYQLHMRSGWGARWKYGSPKFEELLGKTIIDIYGAEVESEVIAFICDDGSRYIMYHEQDCCESVDVNDICGDVACLLNTPITKAEKTTEEGDDKWGTHTWTFYHLGTVKGYVTIRWYGASNGYYSESVSLAKIQ
jgi:hypothetical protein